MSSLLDPVVIPGEAEFQLPGDGILAPASGDVPQSFDAACTVCGASRVEGQDWCLECGTAFAAQRGIPGVQTVALAGAFTLLMAGGAVAAGVAAINDTLPPRKTEVKVVAQTADVVPTTPDSVPLTDPVPSDLPPIDTAPVPLDTGSTTTTTTPVTPVVPKPAHPVIELGADAASIYDPDDSATSSNEPSYAVGKKATPSWFVTTAPGDTPGVISPMNVGLNVDLGSAHKVTKLTLTTVTPGFTVTVLGSNTVDPPQSVDDPKWTTLGEAASVDAAALSDTDPQPNKADEPGDKTLLLGLGGRSKKYRNIVLWFTAPPTAGPTVRIAQLKFFG
ncbi:unannotated protein [freshwater metagenome]|uniref:Unannotated protein n=1 Tax=freshwater metagenome TaxID=449393 RepID=A0A6J7RU13_9ZZZZ|nr:hypothetical protein [Actinomycetota bacterium]